MGKLFRPPEQTYLHTQKLHGRTALPPRVWCVTLKSASAFFFPHLWKQSDTADTFDLSRISIYSTDSCQWMYTMRKQRGGGPSIYPSSRKRSHGNGMNQKIAPFSVLTFFFFETFALCCQFCKEEITTDSGATVCHFFHYIWLRDGRALSEIIPSLHLNTSGIITLHLSVTMQFYITTALLTEKV